MLYNKKETVTVVSGKTSTGTINGIPQYRYTTASRTYYVPDGEKTTSETLEREAYKSVTVELPVYSGGKIVSTQKKTYYEISGTELLTPSTETVEYLECTIHPFDQGMILKAFKIDTEKPYDQFGITYGQAIVHMATAPIYPRKVLKKQRASHENVGDTRYLRTCCSPAKSPTML